MAAKRSPGNRRSSFVLLPLVIITLAAGAVVWAVLGEPGAAHPGKPADSLLVIKLAK